MTFEEFFKKKRIDLAAFEKGEPALFFEFKTHFEQMGEKSFDHTKKYWFNNLRRQYHLAPEIRTEKPKIENPIAEQTVADSLTEQAVASHVLSGVPQVKPGVTEVEKEINKEATTAPKPGFTPRFKAANMSKPADAPPPASEEKKDEAAPAPTPPKLGFTPKFKAANMSKPADAPASEEKKEEPAIPEEKPKIGFTPRFKAGVTKPAETPTEATRAEEEKKEEEAPTTAAPKLGFKPKFKPSAPKPPEE